LGHGRLLIGLLLAVCVGGIVAAKAADPAPNGIAYPEGWQDWAVIAASYRTDNQTIRVILGNDVAVAAARSGKTNPWPDGAVLGKVVWKEADLADWPPAKAPKTFVHAEFMFKDAKRYSATKGWGWARWTGLSQKPYGANAEFAQECIACHTPVAKRDHVFTDPAPLPKR
jgi:hypothetical protein